MNSGVRLAPAVLVDEKLAVVVVVGHGKRLRAKRHQRVVLDVRVLVAVAEQLDAVKISTSPKIRNMNEK